MKKTETTFSSLKGLKAMVAGLVLVVAFMFVGMNSASAQINVKGIPTVGQLQTQLETLTDRLDPLPADHPKVLYYAEYITYWQAVIVNMQGGMSYHDAVRNNDEIMPANMAPNGQLDPQGVDPSTYQDNNVDRVQPKGNGNG